MFKVSQIFLLDSGGARKYPGISAYGRSDSNRHLMSPVVGTKPVVLDKLVNPYLLPRALGFDPRVYHIHTYVHTYTHTYTHTQTHTYTQLRLSHMHIWPASLLNWSLDFLTREPDVQHPFPSSQEARGPHPADVQDRGGLPRASPPPKMPDASRRTARTGIQPETRN
jgi:hypothetical protein